MKYRVDKLSEREQRLLLTMRDYLFEQHSRMQNMFRRCDPDGNGYVSIEVRLSYHLCHCPLSTDASPVPRVSLVIIGRSS